MFCKSCSYDLRTQIGGDRRCPECGQTFDPANPKTFLKQPRKNALLWRWTRRVGLLLLGVAILLGATWGWLYYGWKKEQNALARLPKMRFSTEPLGGTELQKTMGGYGWVLDRARKMLPSDYNNEDLEAISQLEWMEEFHFYGSVENHLTDAGVEHLANLTELRVLKLWDNPLTARSLSKLGNLTKLRELELYTSNLNDTDLIHLDNFRQLERLNLSGNHITDAGLKHLTQFKKLHSLRLYRTAVMDPGLILQDLPALEELYVAGIDTITGKSLEHLQNLKSLKKFCGGSNLVTDADLACLKELKTLQVLRLAGDNITDAGVKHLKELTWLKELEISDTNISPSGSRELKAALSAKIENSREP